MNRQAKKISYISIIILIIGSTIGAGIFFKNTELLRMSHGDIAFLIGTWTIAIVAMLCLGLALTEIVSNQKTNQGVLEWAEQFLPKTLAKASKNYYNYLFVPLTMFTLPIYAVSSFKDAGLNVTNLWIVAVIAFAIFTWFMLTSLISLKFGEYSGWFLSFMKAIPLIALPILAFVFKDSAHQDLTPKSLGVVSEEFYGKHKWFVIFGGIPAIAFAFDGFYTAASLKEEMKPNHKNKLPLAISIGILIVAVFYVFLTIGFAIGTKNGSVDGLNLPFKSSEKLMSFFYVCIGFAIMGIVNGYALSSPLLLASIAKDNTNHEVHWLTRKLFKNYHNNYEKKLYLTSWIVIYVLSALFFVVFTIISNFYSLNNWSQSYGSAGRLYSLSDILVNFTSLLIFVVISGVVISGIINRFTNKIAVQKSKLFLPTAIISSSIFMFSSLFYIIAAFYDAIANNSDWEGHTGAIIKVLIFIAIIALSFFLNLFTKENQDEQLPIKTLFYKTKIKFTNLKQKVFCKKT